jgi:hypothetical protein
MENPINHRDLEGIVVNLVNSSAVAQAKPSRSGFDPFERQLFCPFLIFKNCVLLSVIVNDFKFIYPCFAVRLGGVSGGKKTQGWRGSSHTAMVGAGKFGSAKLPMATATYPGKPSPSQ